MSKAKVTILIEGYVNKDIVVPTTTLIQDGEMNIVVDPGMGRNKSKHLKNALVKEGLTLSGIQVVFTTHYHLDHTQHVGLFFKAKLIDYLYTYNQDKWSDHKGNGYGISSNVSIIHTPGHSYEHASLIVKSEIGTIIVAGDVWWFSDKTPIIDEMALDQNKLENSRKEVLSKADYVIPGHGTIFKVEK